MTFRPLQCLAGALQILSVITIVSASALADNAAFPQSDLMRIVLSGGMAVEPMGARHRQHQEAQHGFVHMGEFAWALMEPQESKLDFDWLERNVQLCAAQGLKVVLCTPSPTPPAWLSGKHPEVLMVDAAGRKMSHGTRQHACWSVQTYRAYVGKITDELGKRFGNDSRVWGWQCLASIESGKS